MILYDTTTKIRMWKREERGIDALISSYSEVRREQILSVYS